MPYLSAVVKEVRTAARAVQWRSPLGTPLGASEGAAAQVLHRQSSGRKPTAPGRGNAPRAPITRARLRCTVPILLQVLRLYPAIPVFPRQAEADDVLPSGHKIRAGACRYGRSWEDALECLWAPLSLPAWPVQATLCCRRAGAGHSMR